MPPAGCSAATPDRSDDVLKAGGLWVSPGEVEARLREHALEQIAADRPGEPA
jgi:acyl-coenzyme A synthetase/AMP-(fatty) acid ligase